MAKQSPRQQAVVERVMHEFKEGELESSSGDKVKNPKQAIAIALSESGSSNRQSPKENARRLRKSEAKAGGVANKAELYAKAKRQGVAGRSRMSKGELERALQR